MGCTLLTGWAIPPEFIDTPDEVAVFDSTIAVKKLIYQKKLLDNWNEVLFEEFTTCGAPKEIIGFSMGAIFATALAQQIGFEKITLLSPTFSFTAGKDNPHGIPKKILQNMIDALAKDPSETMDKFYKNCGIRGPVISSYSGDELTFGLLFLLEAELELKKFKGSPEINIIHASGDRIISKHASRDFASYYSVMGREVAGGHIAPLMKLFL